SISHQDLPSASIRSRPISGRLNGRISSPLPNAFAHSSDHVPEPSSWRNGTVRCLSTVRNTSTAQANVQNGTDLDAPRPQTLRLPEECSGTAWSSCRSEQE